MTDRLVADPPSLPDLPAQRAPLDAAQARALGTWAETELREAELDALEASGLSVIGARLERVGLRDARLPGLRMVDALLTGCDLATVRARGASLVRCELRGCRLTGSSWSEARWTDVLVKGCRVDLAAFTASTLERVRFEDCLLTQSDFQEAACDSVRFHGCDLTEADLSGARFRRSELRRCTLDLLRGVDSMRGIGMQLDDLLAFAPVLADALGVRVLDVGDG